MFDVVVVGSFVIDLVFRVPERPRPGESVLCDDVTEALGGKGFNQAVAAARAGARTAMVGCLGTDPWGERFLAALASEEVDAGGVVSDPAATGIAAPVVDATGENAIVVAPRANLMLDAAHVRGALRRLGGAAVVLLQGEVPAPANAAAASWGSDAGALVILNPSPLPVALPDVGGFVLNAFEAARLTGVSPPAAAAAHLAGDGGVAAVTLGPGGAVAFDTRAAARAGEGVAVAGHEVTVVDPTGAGDTFAGYLAAGLAAGGDLRATVAVANAAGALAVTAVGAEPSIPSRGAVDAFLRERTRIAAP